MNGQYEEILDFWFGESRNENRNSLWWHGIHPSNDKLKTTKDIDLYITEKWGKILGSFPVTNEIDLFDGDHPLRTWLYTVDGTMAMMILFDQFPRHIYRGTKQSFAFDKYALILAERLLGDHLEYMTTFYKVFCYVTLMHSENKQSVEMCTYGILKLAYEEQDEKRKANLKKTASVSQEHLDVLVKFGRYPHRNAILGRVNTMEETDFLANKKLPLWMRSVSPNKVSDPKDVSKENKTTNVTLTESKNKLKILVLHSNRQSGQMFRSKTEHYLERKLKNIADLTYCDAPKLYEPRGEAESLIKDKEYTNVPNVGFTRAWWNASDDPQTMVYRGLEESLEYINSLFYNSHFDGIIGFSQGGAMTGIISALVSDFHKSDVSYIPIDSISKYLKFVVIISGFYCRDTRPQFFNSIMEELPVKHSPEHVKIRKDPITIPSFHTWGTSDNLVDPWRSEKLSQAFSDKVIHTHPSGHFIKAIKYWPVDEMCKWLGNFVPKESVPLIDYRKVALELFSYGGLNCKYLIKFISDHNKVAVGELITYMVQSGECTGTAIYEILEASNIKLPEIIKEKFSLLTPLIGMCSYPSTEKETKLRSLLVEFISTELVNEYEKYYINKNIGIPSNLATYAPRYNTFHRGTRLFHDIAFKIGSLINIFDVAKSSISEDHEKRQTLLCYNQYRKIVSVLSGIITPLRPKPINKKRTVTEKLENLLLTPVSDFILNPRAEPVDIPPTELFEPLYTYLQNEENKNIDEIIFKKGTICVDGRLDLCKQVVGPKGINGLIESLKLDSATPDPKIRHLLLGNNVCGNELGIAIGKFIKSGKSALTTWYIAGNNLDADGIAPICEALYGDEQIRQLWLKRNPIRAKGIPHIANMFKHNTYLQVLDLTNTGLMDEGAILLLNNLSQTLKYLYLSSNGLTVKTCEEIANVLHTTTLDSIALGCNRLTDNGAFYISKALEHPDCPLKSIEIASCAIGPVGTKYLAGALMTNKTLIHLNFGFLKSTSDLEEIPNIIGSLGASYLAGSLTINSTLRSLDLIHTGIQQAGISAIANVLSTKNNTANITANITLLYLNIEQFGIPHNELSREIIRKSLQRNKEYVNEETLKYIELYVNPPHLEEIKSVYRIK